MTSALRLFAVIAYASTAATTAAEETAAPTTAAETKACQMSLDRAQDELRETDYALRGAMQENERILKQNKELSAETSRLKQKLQRAGIDIVEPPEHVPCSASTNLRPGMTKKQVRRLLGDPTQSSMATCGGAPGVKRWACETLSYKCDNSDYRSIEVMFGGDYVNNWEVH